jgi:hypothetical protein
MGGGGDFFTVSTVTIATVAVGTATVDRKQHAPTQLHWPPTS